jgi:hypothetical protein
MATSQVEQLARRSQFIFRGTVERLEASTFPQLPPQEDTAVVKVREVIHSPVGLDDFTGRDVTVLLAKPEEAEIGQEGVFFTTSWLYGESIAVLEEGHVDADEMPAIRKGVARIIGGMRNEELQARLARANLVVVGKVQETRPFKSDRPQPVSEHAPDWWQADLTVDSVEKGRWAEGQITILFPASTDEFWSDSPKFAQGDEGIWILQRDQNERGWPVMRESGFTALHSFDFHPRSEIERIRNLVVRKH